MYPNCNCPKFADQICNVSPMRSIGWIHVGYILNVPHFSNVIALCPKCGRSIKLGTLRSHDWVHSKSDQHFSQEQIKSTFMGTFSINPTFAHWAHWSHLLSVLPIYPACAWWVFGALSPVSSSKGSGSSSVDAIEDGAVAGDHGVYHAGWSSTHCLLRQSLFVVDSCGRLGRQ